MKQLTITQIYRNNKSKDGKPFVTKDGRPFEKTALLTKEYGNRYISGFSNNITALWKIGDVIEIEVEEVISKNGNAYLNFKTPNRLDQLETRVGKLEIEVKALMARSREE